MKRLLATVVIVFGIAGLASSLEAGGGISVFVPESLYLHGQGSISVETNFQYALGLTKLLSIPIGISYNKVYGYTPGGTTALDQVTTPWFFGDSIMGYVMAKVHLPVSIFYLDLFGGGAANWNATLTPVGQSIESYLAGVSGADAVAFPNPSYGATWGFGWLAGAGLGVSIKKVRVDLSATYRDIRSALTLSGTYYAVNSTAQTATTQNYSAPSTAVLIMRGVSVGINAHFSL